jgi:WD40 repeat protein
MLGSVPQYKTEEYMKSKLSSEEDEVNQVIKAEYLKNSSVENITVSAPILFIN